MQSMRGPVPDELNRVIVKIGNGVPNGACVIPAVRQRWPDKIGTEECTIEPKKRDIVPLRGLNRPYGLFGSKPIYSATSHFAPNCGRYFPNPNSRFRYTKLSALIGAA